MRDIWAAPPGGSIESVSRERKSHLKALVAAGLVMSLGLGVGGVLRWMGASTPVASETVLAQYRADAEAAASEGSGADTQQRSGDKGRAKNEPRKRQRASNANRHRGSAAVAAPVSQRQRPTAANRPAARGNQPAANSETREARRPGRPEEGVYTWAVDGYEKAPGTNRTLPEESHRVVTWQGQNRWIEHHVFSEQKETWLNLQFADKGVSVTSNRNRVVMGPVTVDKTIVFNPPMFVGLVPFKLGQTWEGSWRGKTSGEYQARTFDHTTLVIGGQEVEVWATEVRMTMRGEVAGTATVRSWVSPEYNLVVKQYQDTRVTTGPGEYRSEWTGQVKSLQPQR
ncbi:MAG TPA: hypothetical protein VG929_05745 [Actinomycetota bacterium]|nr:hypothetical protein [Actinomycetota bacterium]